MSDAAHGHVVGTDDATPLEFWVSVTDDQPHHLRLDDVVALTRKLPHEPDPVRMYGIVTQMRARHDGAQFDSDVTLVNAGMLPAAVSESAQILTTRFEPEVYVPPLPGQPVHLATGNDRNAALFYDTFDPNDLLPAGLSRTNERHYIDLSFLDGRSGAHVNISGVSGVATKTTYAMFLLHAMFTSGQLANAHTARALVFNLKGADLMWLDHPNINLTDDQKARYDALGLPATPFQNVGLYAPPKPRANKPVPHSERTHGVNAYAWTLTEFAERELLPFLFADPDDERQQYGLVVTHVTRLLAKAARSHPRNGGGFVIEGQHITTFDQLVDLLGELVTAEDNTWRGPSIGPGTAAAFARRLYGARNDGVGALIRGDIIDADKHRIDLSQHQVTVVDLAQLPDRAQRFVVGVLLHTLFDEKTQTGTREPVTAIVLDELGRYAPREGTSPIAKILVDISERGRSLGLILIGAQQSASTVDRRIISNSAIRVVGRLDSAEATRPEYAWLPTTHRQRATIIKPGTMLVGQPRLPVPIPLEFPWPAWATRRDETDPASRPTGPTDTDVDQVFTTVADPNPLPF